LDCSQKVEIQRLLFSNSLDRLLTSVSEDVFTDSLAQSFRELQ